MALIGALLVTLATPATWPLALGAFLIRGGILLVVVPVVVLPTPVGLANAFGPLVTAIALGSVTGSMIAAGGAAVLAVVALLFGGAWLAAALEAEAIRIVALDEDLAARRPGREAVRPSWRRRSGSSSPGWSRSCLCWSPSPGAPCAWCRWPIAS